MQGPMVHHMSGLEIAFDLQYGQPSNSTWSLNQAYKNFMELQETGLTFRKACLYAIEKHQDASEF